VVASFEGRTREEVGEAKAVVEGAGSPLFRDRGGSSVLLLRDVDGLENHALSLQGWWRRPHIPARGEEARGSLPSSSIGARDSRNPPHPHGGEVGWGLLAARQSIRQVPVGAYNGCDCY